MPLTRPAIAIALALAAASPLAAQAAQPAGVQPATVQGVDNVPSDPVTVRIGSALQQRAARYAFGQRELDYLGKELGDQARKALARGAAGGVVQRLDLTIEDAVPNKPTFEQLGREVSLSYQGSRGLGGITLGGVATLADGSTRPLSYQRYETDLRNDLNFTTWGDADQGIDIFVHRISRGDYGPTRVGYAERSGGDFIHRFPS